MFSLIFHPYDWSYNDPNLLIWGLDQNSEPLLVIIKNPPLYCYYELADILWTENKVNKLIHDLWQLLRRKFPDNLPYRIEYFPRKKLYGYSERRYPFLVISYPSEHTLRRISNYLSKVSINITTSESTSFKPHENWISPLTKFLAITGCRAAQWLEISVEEVKANDKISTIREYYGDWTTIKSLSLNLATNPSVMVFDIEAYSDNDRTFTNSLLANHVVYMISVIYRRDKLVKRYLLTTLAIDKLDDIIVITANSEINLIQEFERILRELDPTIILGYNIFGYDYPYMNNRLLRLNKRWGIDGRLLNLASELVEGSGKYGSYYYLSLPGRLNLDLYRVVKKEFNLPNYRLNTVALEVLGEGKHDLPAADMFAIYRQALETLHTNSSEVKDKLQKIALYCIQDSELVLKIYDKIHLWIGLVELANIVNVPIFDLYTRGQQIRCLSQIYCRSHEEYVIDKSNTTDDNTAKYKGGFVMDPIPGLHERVICLDFKSMYPSIIQCYNICYTTFVTDSSIPDEQCNVVEWTEGDNHYRYRFVKPNIRQGVLAELVRYLVEERNRVRSEQKKYSKDSLEFTILEKRQLALKISANAMYGFLGVRKSYSVLSLIPAAMSITAMGRILINSCRNYLESKYKVKTIYGDTDSIMFQLPNITTYQETITWGKKLEKEVSGTLPPPLCTEFEKAGVIFCVKKKHYAFWLADDKGPRYKQTITIRLPTTGQELRVLPNDSRAKDPNYHPEIVNQPDLLVKGILSARKDNCSWQREFYQTILNAILEGKSYLEVFDLILNQVCRLLYRQVPKSKLIIYQEYRTSYKDNSNYFFRDFCQRLIAKGVRIQPGERLGYLVTRKEGKLADKLVLVDIEKEESNWDPLYYIQRLRTSINEIYQIAFAKDIARLAEEYTKIDQYRFYYYFNQLFNIPLDYYLAFFPDFPTTINYLCTTLTGKELKVVKWLYNTVFRKRSYRIDGQPLDKILELVEKKENTIKKLVSYYNV